MTDEHDTLHLSVRSLEIVSADGAHRRHLRVFCPVESRSLDPRTCARCDLCVSFPEDAGGEDAELQCRIPRRTDPPRSGSWFVGSEAVAVWLPAGTISVPVTVCVRFDTPIQVVGEALERNAVGTALVVDERTRVLGVVGPSELATRRTTPVLAVVNADVARIDESAPLSEVISRMAFRRAHRVALVRSDGSAAGLVTEVNVLHWIAVGGSPW